MLAAVISMGPHLDEFLLSKDDLMAVGASHARDVHAVCNDVAAMIFPSAISPPTEAMISAVTNKLVALVADIETRLQVDDLNSSSDIPTTWPLLAQSGFLRDPGLIDYMLARVAEDRLENMIITPEQPLPSQLLDHADAHIADAAQALLAADSLHRRARGFTYQALRPELLHQLCWRLVAAIEVGGGQRDVAVIANARALLSDYDESRTAQAAAHKLTHFLGDRWQAALLDPKTAGLHLYVANMAKTLEIDHDHVLHLIGIGSAAPLCVMLSAAGIDAEQAMATVYQFNGFALTPRDIALFDRGFLQLDQDSAKAEVRRWAYERGQYLMFPHIGKSSA